MAFDPDEYLGDFDPDQFLGEELTLVESPLEAGLIATGKGMMNIYEGGKRLMGMDVEKDPETTARYEQLQQDFPVATLAGEVVGETAPFLVPGLGQAGATQKAAQYGPKAAKAASALYAGALGVGEAGLSALGREEEDAGEKAAMGGAIAGAVDVAIPNLSRVGRAVVRRLTGRQVEDAIDAAGKLTQESIQALQEAQVPPEQVLQVLETAKNIEGELEGIAGQIKEAARKGDDKRLRELTQSVEANPDMIEAAKELGMDQLLMPSYYSNNPAYVEMEQGLASIIGSELGAKQKVNLEAIKSKSQDVLNRAGAKPIDVVESGIQTELEAVIDDVIPYENELYTTLAGRVDRGSPVDVSGLANDLIQEAKDLGDEKLLSPLEKQMLDLTTVVNEDGVRVPADNVTFYAIDRMRKRVGDALGKKSGVFGDTESYVLGDMYSQLSDVQGKKYDEMGMGEVWQEAKDLTKQRKGAQDQLQNIFGKDLSASIIPKMNRAVSSLTQGNTKYMDKILKDVPKEMQDELVVSSLSDVITKRSEQGFNLNNFVNFMGDLNTKPKAKEALYKHLTPEAKQELESLYKVSKGVNNALKDRIYTGKIQSLLREFETGNLAERVKTGTFEGAKTMAGEGVASMFGMSGAPTMLRVTFGKIKGDKQAERLDKLADNLLASGAFEKAMIKAIDEDNIDAGSKVIEMSPAYKKWYNQIPKEQQRQVASLGFMNWVLGEDDGE